MKLVLLTMVAFASTANAQSAPHRDAGFTVNTMQTRDALTLCIARKLKASPIALGDKTVIDFHMPSLLRVGPSYFSLEIADNQSHRVITANYRHPLTLKSAVATIRDVGKSCYRNEFDTALASNPVEGIKPIDRS